MTKARSRTETEIPLYLLPTKVAEKVQEWGGKLYRISVRRTHWHYYNVTVRTKPQRREIVLRDIAVVSSSGPVAGESHKRVVGARHRRSPA